MQRQALTSVEGGRGNRRGPAHGELLLLLRWRTLSIVTGEEFGRWSNGGRIDDHGRPGDGHADQRHLSAANGHTSVVHDMRLCVLRRLRGRRQRVERDKMWTPGIVGLGVDD
jgi:hypothetical protein